VQGFECRVEGVGFRVQGSGFRVQGVGFGVDLVEDDRERENVRGVRYLSDISFRVWSLRL